MIDKWLVHLDSQVRSYCAHIAAGGVIDPQSLRAFSGVPGGALFIDSCYRAEVLVRTTPDPDDLEAYADGFLAAKPQWIKLLIKQYVTFELRMRIRVRRFRRVQSDVALTADRYALRVICAFLEGLHDCDVALNHLSQGYVDTWLLAHSPSHHRVVGCFFRWLFEAGIVERRLTVPRRRDGPRAPLGEQEYFAVVDRACTDETMPLVVRVALLLVALCCKRIVDILRLRSSDVVANAEGPAEIRFGKGEPQTLEGEPARLVLELAARSHTWLIPSRYRPRPLGRKSLHRLICDAGVTHHIEALRSAGLVEKLRDIDATEVIVLLGYHPSATESVQKRKPGLSAPQKADVVSRFA